MRPLFDAAVIQIEVTNLNPRALQEWFKRRLDRKKAHGQAVTPADAAS